MHLIIRFGMLYAFFYYDGNLADVSNFQVLYVILLVMLTGLTGVSLVVNSSLRPGIGP